MEEISHAAKEAIGHETAGNSVTTSWWVKKHNRLPSKIDASTKGNAGKISPSVRMKLDLVELEEIVGEIMFKIRLRDIASFS